MRKPIIVGNWKMNKNNAETKAFFEAVDGVAASENATYGIGCPFTDLRTALDHAKNLVVAAENCHFEDSGAFTGEVSVPMLEEWELNTALSVIQNVVKCSVILMKQLTKKQNV